MSTPSYPNPQVFKYDDWPSDLGCIEVEFRLIYQGKLPAASQSSTRVREKHQIRKALHPQLAELWKSHPTLRFYLDVPESARLNTDGTIEELGPRRIQRMADNYARCGYRFVPLVGNADFGARACALDILFLRRDEPGQLVSGGDLDNRIKVLFDALKMPRDRNEVCGESPGPDEDPFYCLLVDDSLITEIKITTDRLLAPVGLGEHKHDVHLVIGVRTLAIHPMP